MNEAVKLAPRVLIVEDEIMVAMMIEDVLTDYGFRLAGHAPTVGQALAMVDATGFDVAILDLNLDGEDTYGVADKLRGLGLPFIFSTGYGADGVRAAYRNQRIIEKPFDPGELTEALRKALDGG
jgi:CheY-like chemotaxis protein